jgi:hypothetical protein
MTAFVVEISESIKPEAEFLDENQTKVSRAFLLVFHSHLYSFALTFPLHFFELTQPLTVTVKEKEENLIESHAHFPMA